MGELREREVLVVSQREPLCHVLAGYLAGPGRRVVPAASLAEPDASPVSLVSEDDRRRSVVAVSPTTSSRLRTPR